MLRKDWLPTYAVRITQCVCFCETLQQKCTLMAEISIGSVDDKKLLALAASIEHGEKNVASNEKLSPVESVVPGICGVGRLS